MTLRTAIGAMNHSMGDEESGSDKDGFEPFRQSHQKASAERSQPTCLVVEDDRTMRHLVMNYLEEHGIRTISASGREEVAGLLAREEPSLVILDLRLGQEDGLDLLREIRSHSDIPVIIITGLRQAAQQTLCAQKRHRGPRAPTSSTFSREIAAFAEGLTL